MKTIGNFCPYLIVGTMCNISTNAVIILFDRGCHYLILKTQEGITIFVIRFIIGIPKATYNL